MTSSLKLYVPVLAERLGTTPAALYERQRALVRAGILEQSEGRGPGSGVAVSPYSVALLLVAVLATDSLTETAEKVRIFATAKSIGPDGLCPLTRRPTFVEAIALLLDPAHQHWKPIENITVHRSTLASGIRYKDGRGSTLSEFAAKGKAEATPPAPTKLLIDAMLTRDLIIAVAMDLKKKADAQQRVSFAALELMHGLREARRKRRLTEVKKR